VFFFESGKITIEEGVVDTTCTVRQRDLGPGRGGGLVLYTRARSRLQAALHQKKHKTYLSYSAQS
jgi:hypothetical protein